VSKRLLVPLRGRTKREQLFRMGRRWREPTGRVQVIAEEGDESQVLHYVVVVSRAVCPKAVGRNRIRRLLRESLRIIAQQHPELLAPYRTLALRWLSAAHGSEWKRLPLLEVLSAVTSALQQPLAQP
jgi:ribonuclease P protein component